MDHERLPQSIREFIAAITCPVCETKKADGVIVKVNFQQPNLYTVTANCLHCGNAYGWNFSGPPPAAAMPPSMPIASTSSESSVPLPKWVLEAMPAPAEPGPINTPDDLNEIEVPDYEEPEAEREPAALEIERNGGSQEGS